MKERYGSFGINDFPKSEHKKRVSKAQKLMRVDGIDCMVLTAESNIGYFSGFRGTSSVESVDYSSCFFVLPSDGEPTLIISLANRGNVEAMLAVGRAEYVGWSGLKFHTNHHYSNSVTEGLTKVISESRRMPSKIALELGQGQHIGVSLEILDAIKNSYRKTKFVDGSKIIWSCRRLKSDLEVGFLESAAKITCTSYESTFNKVREGMTEKEIARIVYREMLEAGGEDMPLKMFLNIRAGPERYVMCDTRPTERRLRRGDILLLDGGLRYRGYFSDITRLLCVGKPTPEQTRLFDSAREAEEMGIDEMKPGLKGMDLWNSVMNKIKADGKEKNSLFEGIGHGIGLDIHEPPGIRKTTSDELEAGMVLTIEPCLYDDPVVKEITSGTRTRGGRGVFFVEDEVVITKSGNRVLSPISRDLFIA